jgi:hypothetical protein
MKHEFGITAKYQVEAIRFGDGLTRFCTIDDEDNLEIFLQMLKKEGFMVDYYTDAGNALFHFRPEYYI